MLKFSHGPVMCGVVLVGGILWTTVWAALSAADHAKEPAPAAAQAAATEETASEQATETPSPPSTEGARGTKTKLLKEVDFNRDIRPILSDKCFFCHGPDDSHRQANLRLDQEEAAYADRGGYHAIVPGKPAESEVVLRILEEDEFMRMPPVDSGKTLKPEEIALIKTWIEQGAKYEDHWAYIVPQKNSHPQPKSREWAKNWIDYYILSRLEAEGLSPSEEADRVTLIRRLSFDLRGLPPSIEEVDAFVNSSDPDAYEKLVDQFLASDHFGERMAIWWLDLVRFADTVGYHGDQPHRAWPYRDYVINSFNANKRFDVFTREQLAGDLGESPTQEELVATCYNRLLQTSHEGGIQLKEYRTIYFADRVRNVSQVWMGATMGCAQCHNHKYDPYTTEDFYKLGAFFADIDDEYHIVHQLEGLNTLPTTRWPEMHVVSPEDEEIMSQIDEQLATLKTGLEQEPSQTLQEHGESDSVANSERPSDVEQVVLIDEAEPKDVKIIEEWDFTTASDGKVHDGERSRKQKSDQLIQRGYDAFLELLFLPKDRLSPVQKEQIQSIIDRSTPQTRDILEQLTKKAHEIKKRSPRVLYTKRLPEPRTVRVLPRGNWLDESGPIVEPAIPEFLGELETGNEKASRRDLANWLVQPAAEEGVGELTARVQANRFWQLMMGNGIARVLDDFGGQGEPPVHPELLDALAIEFMNSGWDVKHMIKLIAMSATYQQASMVAADVQQVDPDNRLYSHQSRPRLPAEVIRDNALKISGLLVNQIGGPSVHPYQPKGYYRHLNFPTRDYEPDLDSRQYRRGVYVHWQRQFLHPMLKAFDAPSREECAAERPQSNTPVASLVLLNDPTFVEAARAFAERVLVEGGETTPDRLDYAMRLAVSRTPAKTEQAILEKVLDAGQQHYEVHPQEAEKLNAVGMKPVMEGLDPVELAAWSQVTRTILNMNEVITRN